MSGFIWLICCKLKQQYIPGLIAGAGEISNFELLKDLANVDDFLQDVNAE